MVHGRATLATLLDSCQAPTERNYHIFYQLPVASDDALLARLRLTRRPEDYGYTKNSCIRVDGFDDVEEFKDVMESFRVLDFSPAEYEPLFKIVAGLLHLSNVEFEEVSSDSCRLSTSEACVKGRKNAATVLGMDPDALGSGLVEKLIVAKVGSTVERVKSPLSLFNAKSARDSLGKALYNRMFNFLVERVNQSMASGLSKSKNIIGVLDIFGFEIFVSNSFEQLCACGGGVAGGGGGARARKRGPFSHAPLPPPLFSPHPPSPRRHQLL